MGQKTDITYRNIIHYIDSGKSLDELYSDPGIAYEDLTRAEKEYIGACLNDQALRALGYVPEKEERFIKEIERLNQGLRERK